MAAGDVTVLRDRNGQPVQVPSDEVAERLNSGEFTAPPGTRVPVIAEDGGFGTVDVEDLYDGTAEGNGLRMASASELAELRKVREYESQGTRARFEAGARGLTVGASDVAATALGVEPEDIHGRQKMLGTEGTIIEAGMAIAPTMLSGGAAGPLTAARGAGMLARGAGKIPRALTAAGRLAEQAVAKKVGTGLGGRIVSGATAGAVEGIGFSAGQAISQAAITEAELDAEHMLAYMGPGALLGGVVGGGLPVIGAGIRKGAGAVGAGLGAAKRKAQGATIGKLEDLPHDFSQFASAEGRSNVGGEWGYDSLAGQGAQAHITRANERFGKQMKRRPDSQQVRAHMSGKGEVGSYAAEKGILSKGASPEEMWARAQVGKEKAGQVMEGAMLKLDNSGYRPNTKHMHSTIMDKVVKPLDKSRISEMRGHAAAVREKADEMFMDLKEIRDEAGNVMLDEAGEVMVERVPAELSFTEMHQMRAELDDIIYSAERAADGSAAKQLRKMRAEMETMFEDSADEVMESLGETGLYADAKYDYKMMNHIEDVAKGHNNREGARRKISLTDTIAASAVGASSVATATMLGGPLAGLGAAAFAGSAALGHKYLRERGDTFLAHYADKAWGLHKAAQVKEGIARRTAKAVKGFASTTVKKAAKATSIAAQIGQAGETRSELFDRKRKEVTQIAASPMSATEKLTARMASMNEAAGPMVQAMAMAANRGNQHLVDTLPAGNQRSSRIRPDLDETQRVSDREMFKWLNRVKTVESPLSLLDDLENGTITRESVESFSIAYPQMYKDLVAQVTHQVAEMKQTPPYSKLVQLSILFIAPMHPSLEPGFIRHSQMSYQAKAEGLEEDPPSPSQRQPPETAEAMQTKTQRISGQ